MLLILGMKTNVITPSNNRIISASHLRCSQPLLLLLSLCEDFWGGRGGCGGWHGAALHQNKQRTHTQCCPTRGQHPAPAQAAARLPIIRAGEHHNTTLHPGCPVSCRAEAPGRGRESRGAGVRSCVVLCGVMAAWRRKSIVLCCVMSAVS